MTPMAKRKAVGFPVGEIGLCERRACRIVGLARSVQQYRPVPKDDAAAIKRMKELASKNRRYGYLRLHAMPRREGLVVNHKRIHWLYTEQGLQVRTKRRRKLPRRDRIAHQVPERPMQRWSMDFVGDELVDCRRLRVLNIVDDHSRFCPGQIVDVSIPDARVARFFDDLALRFASSATLALNSDERLFLSSSYRIVSLLRRSTLDAGQNSCHHLWEARNDHGQCSTCSR